LIDFLTSWELSLLRFLDLVLKMVWVLNN